MTLFYLTFGTNPTNHQQANFAILTQLADDYAKRIVVMTDAPDFYAFIADPRVEIRILTEKRLTEWQGKHQFFWRIKIKALETLAAEFPDEHLLYMDADTFRFRPLSVLHARLESGQHLMHAREGKLAELTTRTERKMWRQCEGKTFAGVTVNEQSTMFNAGVVGIGGGDAGATIATALAVCDAMCAAGVTRRLVEQFALSLALAQGRELRAANDVIGHYWGNKEAWNPLIGNFFLRQHFAGKNYSQQVTAAGEVNLYAQPIYTRSSGTQRKLTGLVDRVFGKNIVAYLPNTEALDDERSERLRAG